MYYQIEQTCKGQLISKANCQAVNSSKKRTNEFVFTSIQCVFVRFLEEIEDSKKAFQNNLTFSRLKHISYMVMGTVTHHTKLKQIYNLEPVPTTED